MYVQAAIKPNTLLRNGAYGIVMRGVQKCTRGCSSLRGKNKLPLCCIKLDTATDPCMGSGHILVYAFDVLMQIYESVGVSPRDAAKLILGKNIYGLDIDRRAYQLAYFSLMMKARQYNRRIFTEAVKPQVYHPTGFPEGEEYGSLVSVNKLEPMPELPKEQQMTLFDGSFDAKLNAWNFKRLLAQKYDVVITNPPYMGSSGMGAKMLEFVKNNYPDSKSDLFSAFIDRGLDWIKPTGYNCMVTMQSWMFLSSFETMRKKLLSTRTITNLLHMENMVMGIAFGTAVANFFGQHIADYKGQYNYMTMKDIEDDKPTVFPTAHKRNCTASTENFEKIPSYPVAYWVSEKFIEAFVKGAPLGSLATSRNGMKTGENERFLRLWYEVEIKKCCFNAIDYWYAVQSKAKWFPYNKGGEYRKWYGNNDYIVNWENEGKEIFVHAKTDKRNVQDYPKELKFTPSASWGLISSGQPSFRYKESNLSDIAGMSFYTNKNDVLYFLGFCNTPISTKILEILAPTINYQAGDIGRLPIIKDEGCYQNILQIVEQNITLSIIDWDSFESSWDFKVHPLVELKEGAGYGTDMSKWNYTIKSAFENWEASCNERFTQLKANEEEINRIFINIYGLQDELTPEVDDKDVTVRRADLSRDIRSLISYAVGCMFGRYSLDTEGLAYAGGDWDAGKYSSFIPDKDNILPICDDEYFDDDILGRFINFVRVVYGAETLEENLKFIADALGGKGTPREVIRNYFLNDFYTDHCKIYQKRPIYWLFDSGKKNGFKSLIYLHRYQSDLLAKLRTDYVHEQQERYRTQLSHISAALNIATGSERARLLKQQNKLSEQLKEITAFEEKVHHLADQNIAIDLDDGVKKNYEIFTDVLAKI